MEIISHNEQKKQEEVYSGQIELGMNPLKEEKASENGCASAVDVADHRQLGRNPGPRRGINRD